MRSTNMSAYAIAWATNDSSMILSSACLILEEFMSFMPLLISPLMVTPQSLVTCWSIIKLTKHEKKRRKKRTEQLVLGFWKLCFRRMLGGNVWSSLLSPVQWWHSISSYSCKK